MIGLYTVIFTILSLFEHCRGHTDRMIIKNRHIYILDPKFTTVPIVIVFVYLGGHLCVVGLSLDILDTEH